MAYVTDMTKRPVEMLLGLINADNGLGIVESEVEILAPVVQAADADGRNTTVDIDLSVLPSEVEDDFVTFSYERIELATLFGECNPSFRDSISTLVALLLLVLLQPLLTVLKLQQLHSRLIDVNSVAVVNATAMLFLCVFTTLIGEHE